MLVNRGVDYEILKQENFQLKNQITDLKNAFDLNRDVLKILEDQIKEKDPKTHLFYQIISRLTGINNQVMISNMEILTEKNKILAEKKKLEGFVQQLNQKNKQLLGQPLNYPTPKQVHMELREEIKVLHKEILSMNEQKLHQDLQIKRLKKILQEKEIAEQKKPLIASMDSKVELIGKTTTQSTEINKKYESNSELRSKVINKQLAVQNKRLKLIIEELEYRLTLLARIYEIQPEQNKRERRRGLQEEPKRISENQLSLLMFALNNTSLIQDEESQSLKLTITKRLNLNQSEQQKQQAHKRTQSCPHKFSLDKYL